VSPDLLFVLSLATKMVVTALFLIIATFAAERAGPVVGGMISTVPISAGPAYVFLSLDHDIDFIVAAVLGSFAINVATCIFVLTYVVLAQKHRLVVSIGAALVVWFAAAAVIKATPWTTATAIIANGVAFVSCLTLGNRYRHAAMPAMVPRWYDMPLRAAMVAVLVAVVITLSASVGPALTGILAAFPIVLFSLMLILHPRMGGPATAAVLANSLLGLIGFALFCLTLHLAAMPLGFAAGFTLAVAVNVVCNFGFWAIRRRSVNLRPKS